MLFLLMSKLFSNNRAVSVVSDKLLHLQQLRQYYENIRGFAFCVIVPHIRIKLH